MAATTKDRALKLLGSGLTQTVVASALGVTESQISQFMADKTFADEVAALRFQNLQGANERDGKYDKLEDKLLDRLEEVADYITKPRDIISALEKLNKAVRRGQTAPEQVSVAARVVNLTIPVVLQQRFVVSADNHIVAVGDQEFTTMSTERFKEIADGQLVESSSPLDATTAPALSEKVLNDETSRKSAGTSIPARSGSA